MHRWWIVLPIGLGVTATVWLLALTASASGLPTTDLVRNVAFGDLNLGGQPSPVGVGGFGVQAAQFNDGVQLWAAAEALPPTINNFRPSGWITTTRTPTLYADALDSGSGLSVTSAVYRYSTNGGSSWSGWLAAAVSGANGVTSTQTLTAANVPFNQDSAAQNVLQFSLSDLVGNVALAQSAVQIDLTPPNLPLVLASSSHTASVWSSNNLLSANWSGASDAASGVSGYSVLFDQLPSTLPDTIVDTYGASATSGAQASGANKYFHLRARDAAGNWSASALHAGPYYVDTGAPSSAASSAAISTSPAFTVSWSGSDANSGLASYDIQSRDLTTNTRWITWKSASALTSSIFTGLSGHIYEFRSRARDNVGNLEAYPASADSQTGVANIDLEINPGRDISGIEINQAVQDLNNLVTLIAGKRTFVRCHARSSIGGSFSAVNARLRVYRGASLMGTLSPANAGAAITVKTSPSRGQLDDSYYFDVPVGWLSAGTVTFECEVNLPRKYAESSYANNIRSADGIFLNAPAMNLVLIDVPYKFNGSVQHVRDLDRTQLASWLRRAYPIQTLNVQWSYLDPPYDSLPEADTVNADLFLNKAKDPTQFFNDWWARYYGMASNVGGFMRGLAMNIPSVVASGPAGAACCDSSSWDFDGSFADWYGGHELGHTYGRHHAEFCDALANYNGVYPPDYVAYPYPNGDISPSQDAASAATLYGFDPVGPTVYPPSWKDVMTYCGHEWVSDFTYEGIYNRMLAEKPVAAPQLPAAPASVAGEQLVIIGQILTPTDVITLNTFYRLPNMVNPMPANPGDYHIRLLDSNQSLLADYPFKPLFSPETDQPQGAIAEMAAWITGTRQIVITHGAQTLIARAVSLNTPTITLLSPNGGETLNGSSVNLSWTASDADAGDHLTYSIDYSRDGGATWQPLSGQLTGTQATLNLNLLPGTTQGKFKVWVSDGVNTASDQSNGVFTVTRKAPSISALAPANGAQYVLSQTVSFEASAFDAEDGLLGDARLRWSSSLQGALGAGQLLQTDGLLPGAHLITLTATDSDGNHTQASFSLVVGAEQITLTEIYLPMVKR